MQKNLKLKSLLCLKRILSKNMNNGKLKATVYLPEGTYGIAVLDDKNKDNEMNYTMLGMPKEGFGFANYYHSGFSYPKFSDFAFQHQKAKNKPATVKLRYL